MTNRKRAFVTGAAGFCGHHLAAHLLESGYDVVGFDQRSKPNAGFETYVENITDQAQLQTLLGTVQPDVVFHLAALTDPRLEYRELHRVNALGTLSLLTAVRQICPEAVILVTSSSAVYGRAPKESLPIAESQQFCPTNHYAASKVAQEMVAFQQFEQFDLRIIRTRAFNLTGPEESPRFVTSALARQIAEIEAGLREPVIEVGNLEAVRDFTDVRDAVRAYHLLADYGEPGEVYNVCSGQGTSIRQLLDILLGLSRVCGICVELDPARVQPSDVPVQIGDATCLHSLTGWIPTISLRQTLQDVLDSWKQRINKGV